MPCTACIRDIFTSFCIYFVYTFYSNYLFYSVFIYIQDTKTRIFKMGYALFAQRKVCLTGQLNAVSLQQTQRSNEQYLLATNTLSLQQQMSSMQAAQSVELADLYEDLAEASDSNARERINAQIRQKQEEFNAELDEINREIYLVSVKENAIEMEVKRLDTQVSSLQKQLEAVEEAESSAIDRATPKFNGVG